MQSLGNVYSATSNDESDLKENRDEKIKVCLSNSHKRPLDNRERTHISEVKTEETAPAPPVLQGLDFRSHRISPLG